jgi:hypothetical protein
MIRGAVVGLINNRSLSQQSSGYDDGRVVTLMSADADNVSDAASMFHETWAQIVEVVLGMTMLARKVGWVFPAPLVIIFRKALPSFLRRKTNRHQSLLQDESVLGQKPSEQAKGLECRHPETNCRDHINACLDEKLEDAWGCPVHGISGANSATSGAGFGQEGAVDDGCLQCKRYVRRVFSCLCSLPDRHLQQMLLAYFLPSSHSCSLSLWQV